MSAVRDALAGLDPHHVVGGFLLLVTVALILPSAVVNALDWLDRRPR